MPNSLQSLNDRVWKEWYPGEGQKYQRNGNAMLEVYAAGDCTGKPYQIAKAVGDGNIAALSAAQYIEERSREKKA